MHEAALWESAIGLQSHGYGPNDSYNVRQASCLPQNPNLTSPIKLLNSQLAIIGPLQNLPLAISSQADRRNSPAPKGLRDFSFFPIHVTQNFVSTFNVYLCQSTSSSCCLAHDVAPSE